ncbi:MAG: hypothetical protein EBS97_07515 [Verrucomicrobia bacterium]|nr:hypothetical protein [Verrucomicrobiota bacterium]
MTTLAVLATGIPLGAGGASETGAEKKPRWLRIPLEAKKPIGHACFATYRELVVVLIRLTIPCGIVVSHAYPCPAVRLMPFTVVAVAPTFTKAEPVVTCTSRYERVLLLAKTVTAVLAVATVPDPSIKVTLGSWGVSAGKEPMVTLFPTVTDEIETGTVPLMLAVTLPICAVPAERAGSELTVTVVDASVTPWVGTDASETGCVDCQNVPETGTIPLMEAVTLPIWFVPAASAGKDAKETG